LEKLATAIQETKTASTTAGRLVYLLPNLASCATPAKFLDNLLSNQVLITPDGKKTQKYRTVKIKKKKLTIKQLRSLLYRHYIRPTQHHRVSKIPTISYINEQTRPEQNYKTYCAVENHYPVNDTVSPLHSGLQKPIHVYFSKSNNMITMHKYNTSQIPNDEKQKNLYTPNPQ